MAEYFEVKTTPNYISTKRTEYLQAHSTSRLNKNNVAHQRYALQLFKDQIGSSTDFLLKDKSCSFDDNFLYRFLHKKKFVCNDAFQLLLNYMQFKTKNMEILKNINIHNEHIQAALKDGNPTVLKQRDRRGRKIITFTAANWNPDAYSLEDVFKALLLTIEKLSENITNQMLGFVVIVDWTNFTFKQSTHLTPRILNIMIDCLQNCLPIKFKGIHFIAQPWFVNVALSVIKPFFDEKTKKRLVLHGTNLNSLHNFMPKDILPHEFGGDAPTLNSSDWFNYCKEAMTENEAFTTYKLLCV